MLAISDARWRTWAIFGHKPALKTGNLIGRLPDRARTLGHLALPLVLVVVDGNDQPGVRAGAARRPLGNHLRAADSWIRHMTARLGSVEFAPLLDRNPELAEVTFISVRVIAGTFIRELPHGGDVIDESRLSHGAGATMSDYHLYYWSIPFRGQFVRAVLAFAGKTWTEAGDDAIQTLMQGAVRSMPVPFMGPPLLIDTKADFAIAQMPAILLYLAETLDLMPATSTLRALATKVVNDCNDVLDEITMSGGRSMWTEKDWDAFIPRLKKWMSFWEETGRRHGLEADTGFLLGGETAGIADLVTATLWSTMGDRFHPIEAMLQESAPMTAALTRRVAALPPLAKLAAQARRDYGDAYCGGQIEASLRKVLDGRTP